jgi:hypothetical protein
MSGAGGSGGRTRRCSGNITEQENFRERSPLHDFFTFFTGDCSSLAGSSVIRFLGIYLLF